MHLFNNKKRTEAESNYITLDILMMKSLIVISNGNSISIIFRSKINLFSINPILQGRVVSKVINFCNPMGIC